MSSRDSWDSDYRGRSPEWDAIGQRLVYLLCKGSANATYNISHSTIVASTPKRNSESMVKIDRNLHYALAQLSMNETRSCINHTMESALCNLPLWNIFNFSDILGSSKITFFSRFVFARKSELLISCFSIWTFLYMCICVWIFLSKCSY